MVIHRAIATSFKEPSIYMSLDMRAALAAQPQKTLLHTVPRSVDISSQQSHRIGNQWTFQPFERGVQPRSMVVAWLIGIASDSLGRCRMHHVGKAKRVIVSRFVGDRWVDPADRLSKIVESCSSSRRLPAEFIREYFEICFFWARSVRGETSSPSVLSFAQLCYASRA